MVLAMQMRAMGMVVLLTGVCAGVHMQAQTRDLPTSKEWIGPIPGNPERMNSLPMSMAVSPDGHYVVTVNAGYGTYESHYEQSLAVLDRQTGVLTDFPDARTLARKAKQTLYSGLAFSEDGAHVYVSMASMTDPEGKGKDATGSGIAVYGFARGKLTPERFIKLPMEELAPGHVTRLIGEREGTVGVPYPAALAVVKTDGREKLLVAENLTDAVLLVDAATGAVEHRFDLAENRAVPSVYPGALALSRDGKRAFVALWNASEIVAAADGRDGGPQAGAAEAVESGGAGDASVRVCAGAGWTDALCGVGQSRRGGGGECGGGTVCREGLL
jgi:DNA-binding beta-propeller fold protein YncE